MSNPKWGVKRQCQDCGAHFYDLKRSKVVCPKCSVPFTVEAKPKVKRAIATPPKAPPPAPLKKPADTEMSAEDKVVKEFAADIITDNNLAADNDEDEDEDEDENSFEDASELGKDEDDMAEVIDGGRKVDES